MGDALSDARKDDARDTLYSIYCCKLDEYKSNPSEERRVVLVNAAKAVDASTGGWTPRTKIVAFLEREYGGDFVKTDSSPTTC